MDTSITCSTCSSGHPHRHPSAGEGGEVEICPDAFHLLETSQNKAEYIEATKEKRFSKYLELSLPRDIEKWNRAHKGAYIKGRKAYLSGESYGNCPYEDHRTHRGAICWSRSFITAWSDGFKDMKNIMENT